MPADRQLEVAARREERHARPDLRVLALAHLLAVLQFCGTALLAAVPAGQRRDGGHGLSKLVCDLGRACAII